MPTDPSADGDVTLLLDSSVAVAFVLKGHEHHERARAAIRDHRIGLAGHAWFETYSVLTRLPGRQRRSPADALRVLTTDFPQSAFLGESQASELASDLARLGISGGAVYDALVGAVARQHGSPLLSADVRARATYEALGVTVRFIAAGQAAPSANAPRGGR